MDKITDLFKELRERLSNPLFSSFLLSWVVINWKIWIVLFFYKQIELTNDGYCSYLDFIQSQLHSVKTIWTPLAIALIYTFIFPLARNGILAAGAWYKRWGTDLNLRISKTGQISVAKYLSLRTKYEINIEELVKTVKNESEYLIENNDLKVKNTNLQAALESRIAQENIENELKRRNNSFVRLFGSWVIEKDIEISSTRSRLHLVDEIEFVDSSAILKSKVVNTIKLTADIAYGNSEHLTIVFQPNSELEIYPISWIMTRETEIRWEVMDQQGNKFHIAKLRDYSKERFKA